MDNSKYNDIYKEALEKIKHDQKCKPKCCCMGIVGPTGPTGPSGGPTGPTHTLISESKIYFYRHFFNIMA